jgi:hypothetical protein
MINSRLNKKYLTMLQRFIERIDAIGDRIHPIVVLLLRKYYHSSDGSLFTLILVTHAILLGILLFLVFFVLLFGTIIIELGRGYILFPLFFPLFAGFSSNGYFLIKKVSIPSDFSSVPFPALGEHDDLPIASTLYKFFQISPSFPRQHFPSQIF